MATSVAIVEPYWGFWENSVHIDLRADRLRLLMDAADALGRDMHVAVSGLLETAADAGALAEQCAKVDAVVLLTTMAAPAASSMAFLDLIPGTPVVVWALIRDSGVPADFSHSDITMRGATVGAPMVVSALARAGRSFDVVLTTLREPGPAVAAARRAGVAGLLRRTTLLRIGAPLPGYTSVDATDDDVRALGISIIDVPAAEVAARSKDVSASAVALRREQVNDEFDVDPSVSRDALNTALRVEVALDNLVSEYSAAAGTLNCHGPEMRFGTDVGIAPCLALGRLTTRGTPWTCTGDVVTSIAMLAVQALGFPTLYHEIETVDHDADEVLLANTGEHDLRLCGKARPRLVPDIWYENDDATGPCAVFALPPGPASLVGFALGGGPTWIVAEGRFTGRSAEHTGTPNGGFRFAGGHVRDAWPRWAATGITHHSVATNALVAADIQAVARHLGARALVV